MEEIKPLPEQIAPAEDVPDVSEQVDRVIARAVGGDKRVVLIAAGDRKLRETLIEAGNEIVTLGIEPFVRNGEADLEGIGPVDAIVIEGVEFDALLRVLEKVAGMLGPGGRVFAAYSNATFLSRRLSLIEGRNLEQNAVDRGHSQAAIRKLFERAGYQLRETLAIEASERELTEIAGRASALGITSLTNAITDRDARSSHYLYVATLPLEAKGATPASLIGMPASSHRPEVPQARASALSPLRRQISDMRLVDGLLRRQIASSQSELASLRQAMISRESDLSDILDSLHDERDRNEMLERALLGERHLRVANETALQRELAAQVESVQQRLRERERELETARAAYATLESVAERRSDELERELADLVGVVESTESELSSTRTHAFALSERIAVFERESENQHESLRLLRVERERLEIEMSELAVEVEALRLKATRYESLDQRIESLTLDAAQAFEEAKRLQAIIDAAEAGLAESRELADAGALSSVRIEELEHSLRAALEDSRIIGDSLREERLAFDSTIDDKNAQIAALRLAHAEVQDQLQELALDNESLRARLRSTVDDLKRIHQQSESAYAALKSTADEREALRSAREELQAENALLREDAKEARIELERAAGEITASIELNEALTDKSALFEAIRVDLEETIATLEKLRAKQEADFGEATASLETYLSEALVQAAAANETLRLRDAQLESAVRESERLQHELSQAREDVASLHPIVGELEALLEEQRSLRVSEAIARAREFDAAIERFQGEIAARSSLIADLRLQTHQAESAARSSTDLLSQANEWVETLTHRLTEQQALREAERAAEEAERTVRFVQLERDVELLRGERDALARDAAGIESILGERVRALETELAERAERAMLLEASAIDANAIARYEEALLAERRATAGERTLRHRAEAWARELENHYAAQILDLIAQTNGEMRRLLTMIGEIQTSKFWRAKLVFANLKNRVGRRRK